MQCNVPVTLIMIYLKPEDPEFHQPGGRRTDGDRWPAENNIEHAFPGQHQVKH